MVTTETDDSLSGGARAAVLDLVGRVTAARGASPLDEQKHRQLHAGSDDRTGRWTGVLARDDSGRLVGYAHLRWGRPGATPRATAELVVDVDAPHAAGGALLVTVEQAVAARGGGKLYVWSHGVEAPDASPPARRGYALQRELAAMARPLDLPPEQPSPPAGVMLRAYQPDDDGAALLAVNNAAFADHPEQGGWDVAELARRTSAAWFTPADLLVAVSTEPGGEHLLGFHWTKRTTDDGGVPLGEVYVLAVDPSAQGRGLGRVLLRAGLAHLHARGCRRCILYVDRADTAAVGLYTGEGFAVTSLDLCHERQVAPAT